MDDIQKSIQAGDDLDQLASRLNIFIADPTIDKMERAEAVKKQLALRQQAADLRVNTIKKIIENTAPTIDEIVAAVNRAKQVANKINQMKDSLDLAAATITFFASLATENIGVILPAWDVLRETIHSKGASKSQDC